MKSRNLWSSAGDQNDISGALADFAEGGVEASDGFLTMRPFLVASDKALRTMVCTYRPVRALSPGPPAR